jgi:hypothetical protein
VASALSFKNICMGGGHLHSNKLVRKISICSSSAASKILLFRKRKDTAVRRLLEVAEGHTWTNLLYVINMSAALSVATCRDKHSTETST